MLIIAICVCQLFIGLGFPYEGPAPLEAIAQGCVFINPKFSPPHSALNTKFFSGKPTHRQASITNTLCYTVTHTQPFYGSLDFVHGNPGEPVPEKTFTHSHISWSSVIPYLLPPSITIHGIFPVHFMCLTVFFSTISLQVFCGLPLCLTPSSSIRRQ